MNQTTNKNCNSNLAVEQLRSNFPVLKKEINGTELVYLDSAASTQKPQVVIDRINNFYQHEYATVNRGVYQLSQQATLECEKSRETCRAFLNAASSDEIIFTKGTTEAINLIASSYGRTNLNTDDEIIISTLEHHANIVPWQELCKLTGAKLKIIPVKDNGELNLRKFAELLSEKTKILAVAHISNALGTIHPIKKMIEMAKQVNVVTVIDGAQAVSHLPVDVQDLDCDFYAFSSHKVFGPTGIGVLYGKKSLLDAMPPYQFGGDMILSVSFEETIFAKTPIKFEAGTPPIAQIIGLGAALEYVNSIDFDKLIPHEQELLKYASEQLKAIDGLQIIGDNENKAGVISFVFDNAHPHDIGTILDECGIAVRAGHHCAQPTMKRYGIAATVRVSFCHYNNKADIDRLVSGLEQVRKVFA